MGSNVEALMLKVFHLLVWFSDVGQSTGSLQHRCCSCAFAVLLYNHPAWQTLALRGVWSLAFWLQDDLIIVMSWLTAKPAYGDWEFLRARSSLESEAELLLFVFIYFILTLQIRSVVLHRFGCCSHGRCSSCLGLLTCEKQLQQQWKS